MFQAVGFGEVCQRPILQSPKLEEIVCLRWGLCHLLECCLLFADWIGFSSEASRDLLSIAPVCDLQAPTIMADPRLLDSKTPRPKKLLFLARCSLHSADRRSQRGGAASQASDTSPRVPEQLALCRLLRISKNQVPTHSYLGQDLKLGMILVRGLVSSGPSPSPKCL